MRLLTSLLLVTVLASCSLQTQLTLSTEGSARVEARFAVAPATRAAWAQLRELDPTLPADPFDAALLRRGLGAESRVVATLTGAELSFPLPDPKTVFPALKAGTDTWELTLDRATVRRLAALTSWAGSPAVEALLPSPTTKVTQAEYRDLLAYLVGPGMTEAAARALVDGSTVQLTVVAPRPLRRAEGALSVEGKTAVYRWPLVRVLSLETPLRLTLAF